MLILDPEAQKRLEEFASATRGVSYNRGASHGLAKLDDALVTEILRRLAAGETQRKIAGDLNVSQSSVSQIKRGVGWRHVPRPVIKPVVTVVTPVIDAAHIANDGGQTQAQDAATAA